MPIGTIFTVIDTSSSQPIAGTFDNLPDGSIVTVAADNLQANYEGGSGDGLTLTAVP
ncbi:MAG TPA: hypothetical protein VGI85_01110 [Chthoniobacterales bacterium]